MVVSVEISGLLEKRLRRLVELGVYASVAEAVREAVRSMLESMDLKKYALDLYVTREASLHYVAEFAGETFESMIDYMISRGVTPAIGAAGREDYRPIEGDAAIADMLTVYVIFKSRLGDIVPRLRESGLQVLVPSSVESYMHILVAERLRRGLPLPEGIEKVGVREVEDDSAPITSLEKGVVEYARREGVALITDDFRTRNYARRRGVKAYSSLSLISTYIDRVGETPPSLPEIVLSLRAIPLIVPMELYGDWSLHGGGTLG